MEPMVVRQSNMVLHLSKMLISVKYSFKSKNSPSVLHRMFIPFFDFSSLPLSLSVDLVILYFSIWKIIVRINNKFSSLNYQSMYLVVRSVFPIVSRLIARNLLASIYTADEINTCSVWPSPEQLKGRILIRVRHTFEEFRFHMLSMNVQGRVTPKNDQSFNYSDEDESFDPDVSVDLFVSDAISVKLVHFQVVCKELAVLIACQNATFKGFTIAKRCLSSIQFLVFLHCSSLLDKHNQSSSLSEKKALSLVENHPLELILNNQRLITRVYPSAYRQDSSNVDAVSFWNTGVQMGSNLNLIFLLPSTRLLFSSLVALNFQTGDISMSLNHGRFTDNKQCGYILKPAVLRDSEMVNQNTWKNFFSDNLDNTTFSPNSCFSAFLLAQRRPLKFDLCVSHCQEMNQRSMEEFSQIISAQHLPKRNQRDSAPVSPFVKVKVFGVRCGRENSSERFP